MKQKLQIAEEIVWINVKDLIPNVKDKEQVERTKIKIEELAEDIKDRGQMYPILVTPYIKKGNRVYAGRSAAKFADCKYWILDGNRRFFACKLAKINEVKCKLYMDLSVLQMLEIQFASNAQRLKMNPYDMAVSIQEYIDEFCSTYGKNKKADAITRLEKIIGYSSAMLKSRLDILEAPDFVQEQIKVKETRGTLPTEIKHALKNKRDRDVGYKALKSKKIISTLDFRPIGKGVDKVDKIVKERKLSKKVRNEMADSMIETFRLPTEKRHDKSYFGKYLAEIEFLGDNMRIWNLDDLTVKQCMDLSTRLGDVHSYLKDIIMQSKKLKRLPNSYPYKHNEEVPGKSLKGKKKKKR